MNKAPVTKAKIAKLERAYMAAHKAEMQAVDALTDKSTKAQQDRCWDLAAAANKARNALTAARAEYMGVL